MLKLGLIFLTLMSFLIAHAQIPPQGNNSLKQQAEKAKKDNNVVIYGDKAKARFAKAKPEDITDENFPQMIESFDYPNAEVSEIVKAIAKLTGKNFIIDPRAASGKITIIAPTPITIAAAYKAFLTTLAMNQMTVVPSGSFLKIRKTRDATTDSIETYTDYFPNTDQLITRIVKLKYINAEAVKKQIRLLKSKDGQLDAFGSTNSLIITDYGTSIERIMGIIDQLDVPGFEEKLAVIRIKYAKAKDISNLIDKIINKDSKGKGRFSSRFSRNKSDSSKGGTSESYSFVDADDRTNSIIVMGNKAGIKRIRGLVGKLDFRLRPEDAGGVYVYYVKHGEAEKMSSVLGGLASESKKTTGAKSGGTSKTAPATADSSGAIFGGDVKVTADKDTNSLIVTASKPDYEVVKSILRKIDIARDQVFVKTIIMEMNASNNFNWGASFIKFDEGSQGRGRFGFNSGNLSSVLNPQAPGVVLGFPGSKTIDVATGADGQTVKLPDVLGFVNFLKSNAGANILSSPEIMAIDNEESVLEVGQEVPIGKKETVTAGGGVSNSIERKKATIKLTITPFISPDTDSLRLNIDQQISQLSTTIVQASDLADSSVVTNERALKTSLNLQSGETAVLGGLMQDKESETIAKVPLLGDIPILGWLFKRKVLDKEKTNLMLFITPTIIRSQSDSNRLLNKKVTQRIDFIRKHMNGRDPHGSVIDNLPRKAGNSLSDEDMEEPAAESF